MKHVIALWIEKEKYDEAKRILESEGKKVSKIVELYFEKIIKEHEEDKTKS